MDEKQIFSLSRDLNEPKWLLQERLKAFAIFNVLLPTHKFEIPETSAGKTEFKSKNLQKDKFADLIEDNSKKDAVKNLFMNRFFKPVHSIEAAFVNAFFREINFFGPKDGAMNADALIKKSGGISIDFFVLPDNFSLGLATDYSCSSIAEFYLYEGAKLKVCSSPGSQDSILLNTTVLGKNSKCELAQQLRKSARIENQALFYDSGADYRENSVFILNGNSSANLNSVVFHSVGETKSEISVRGVVKDSATAIVGGLGKIAKNAKKSESRISEHILILDEEAHAVANPKLEILDNDVIAGHSASVGQIDEDHVFYLMSRGLSEKEAKELIVKGFLGV